MSQSETSSSALPSTSSSVISDVLAAQDLYKVLGVEKSADENQMARARRQRHLALHPDRLGDGGSEQSKKALQLVEDAYSTLSDPQKRAMLDLAQTVGASEAAQQGLAAMHQNLAMHAIFSNATSKSAAMTRAPPQPRKCSCGLPLEKPDDLLCSSCSFFKKTGKCKQMGCLNELPKPDVLNGAQPTETAKEMCLSCAKRRKCAQWGCMKKVDAVERDHCLAHHEKK